MFAESSISIAGTFASWAALTAGTWKLFENADKATSTEAKVRVAAWLRASQPATLLAQISSSFTQALNSVFGNTLFSVRAIFVSCLSSLFCISVAILIWIAFRPDEAATVSFDENLFQNTILFFILVALANLGPDYLSLIKSRVLIAISAKANDRSNYLLLLLLDLMLSLTIGISTFFTISWLSLDLNFGLTFELFTKYIFALHSSNPGQLPIGACFYATLFSSMWFLIYFSAGLFLRATRPTSMLWDILIRFADIDGKPFLAVGLVAIGLETILFVLLILIILLR